MAFSKEYVARMGRILNDESRPMKARFRALFMLRNVGGGEAIEWISRAFGDPSALLKHELAYCLGQMQDVAAVSVLISVLDNEREHPMVRHEAGEALGAIGDSFSLPVLEKYRNDESQEVGETCELAIRRIQWKRDPLSHQDLSVNPFSSVDPTPPLGTMEPEVSSVDDMRRLLIDSEQPLWSRYRAMFSLRNNGSDEAVKALASGLFCEDSALFRHEIAYVLGQLQSPVAFDHLKQRLELQSENSMVRHECAEALGSIATAECVKLLEKYLRDSDRIVRESCEVALDMADYENSCDFQYAQVKD